MDLGRIQSNSEQGTDSEGRDIPRTIALLIQISQAWAMCPIRGGLNLSYECMTSLDTNDRLVNLRHDNPKLWDDLLNKSTRNYCPGDDEEVAEDIEPHEDEELGDDDSEIPTGEVVEHLVSKKTKPNRQVKGQDANAGLRSSGEAKDADVEVEEVPGKRKRRANTLYKGFWRHVDAKGKDTTEPKA
ncbi:hypothetical protein R3P38DRAFT_2573190 [Favolaschia claudopus]|uniref:Uncharacterized protein n=1 Tax=Favolaschia claudopus TaxID=2862362 RepID=A0AAV9ZPN8_9AGAR